MLIAFHLGRVFTLSLAELLAVFEQKGVAYQIKQFYTEVVIIETHQHLDAESLQKRLGGVVKIMEIVDVLPRRRATDFLSFTVKDYFHPNILKSHFLKQTHGKVQFGISVYSLSDKLRLFGQNKRIGMEIKQTLQSYGISCRVVIPEGAALALPSVAVTNNQLLQKGAEIDLIVSEKEVYIGKTLMVQDFADYGRRDYQRPVRDLKAGMLPPKVAQMMINMARVPDAAKTDGSFVLDPFTGSGTIIQEAMLMGYRVFGTDISQKAMDDAEKNLQWFRTRYKLPPNHFELAVCDVKDLAKTVESRKICAVVSEGTLGPAYGKIPNQKEIEKNFAGLSRTYVNAFKQIKTVLNSGGLAVFALPAYKIGGSYAFFPIIDKIRDLGYDIVSPLNKELLEKSPFLKVTQRGSIIYDRKDQVVVREIVIFKTIDS
ncbi:MAG: DNA methyltransferase [Patescibacteria group bacterium]